MGLELMSVSPSEYVVLDVETNGLRSKEHDLLSISLFKPDDGTEFNRFLPLELNKSIPSYITQINGIRKSDLRRQKPLTQDEVDRLFSEFELDSRTILHYGGLDERFIREYFRRHGLKGFDRLKFFNFKRLVCSSRFSDGSLTKDNLCRLYGIEGVTDVHSGINDCRLEWKLFESIGGHHLIAYMGDEGYYVQVLSPEYVVPVSYLQTYPNLSRLYERPYICSESEEVFSLTISRERLRKFPTNFNGITIENLIYAMLGAKKSDNRMYLSENRAKNSFVGHVPDQTHHVRTILNPDATYTAVNDEDRELVEALNATVEQLRTLIEPLVDFIKSDVFAGRQMTSQELVIHEDLGILALCDISTDDSVLEIKAHEVNLGDVAEQLYYEGNGRKTYLLTLDWGFEGRTFTLSRVKVWPGEKPDGRRERALKSISAAVVGLGVEVVTYRTSTSPVLLRCQTCGEEWENSYTRIKSGRAACPKCHPELKKRAYTKENKKRERLSDGERLMRRAIQYADKVNLRSNGALSVDLSSYKSGKERVSVTCKSCGRIWQPRADHLLADCRCKNCQHPSS